MVKMQHQITLTQGKTATVSAQDFRRVIRHKWCIVRRANRKTDYAQTNMKVNGKWTRVLLHRFILNANHGQQVDHVDGNGLNCTHENLRFASRSQKPVQQPAPLGSVQGSFVSQTSWEMDGPD